MHNARRTLFLIVFLFAGSVASAADTYLAPQFDLYLTHNKMFRSHFVMSGNYLVEDGKFSSAWGQYDIDFGLLPFFRRYLFKDPNAEKSKLMSFRLGYLQVSDLKSDPNGFDEKRPLIESVFRLPIGRAWLIEDRNRGEYRMINNDEWWRYRNRLRIERNLIVKKVRLTPYATGEIFYDGKLDDWNEFQGAAGVDIPWFNKTILELECMGQFVDGDLASVSFAFVLQKHL